ncbi:MAG: MFS domain-containing histidine kinase [Hespellia sp.]|nr:MFS domain-containing histidine kinase [Hespellia sp.]
MNQWYKSPWIKAVLSILVCSSTVTAVICGIIILSGINNNYTWHDIANSKTQPYEQSEGFSNTLNGYETDIINQLRIASLFETNGSYDENKLVDLKEYNENEENVSGQNTSGFAYTVGELTTWDYNARTDSDPSLIIVCKKPDGTYHYETFDAFKSQIQEDKLKFALSLSDENGISSDQILSDLYDQFYDGNSIDKLSILNEDNQVIYSDCWTISSWLPESYSPDGADSILDIANQNPEWNGRLSDMMSYLNTAIDGISADYYAYKYPENDFSEGNSNLTYLLLDKTNKKVYTNHSEYSDYDKSVQNIESLKKLGAYVVVTPDLKGFESNLDTNALNWRLHEIDIDEEAILTDFTFVMAVDTTLPIQDTFYTDRQEYLAFMPYMIPLICFAIASLLVFLTAVVWMTIIAGRNRRRERVTLNMFDRIWTELAAVILAGLWFASMFLILNTWDDYYLNTSYSINSTRIGAGTFLVTTGCALATIALLLIGWLSLVRRIKAGTIWKNSLLRHLCLLFRRMLRAFTAFLRRFWSSRKQSSQILIAMILLSVLHLFAAVTYYSVYPIFLVLFTDIVLTVYLIQKAIIREQIKTGIREISEGNVAYRINTKHFRGDDLQVATLVNHIGDGLNAAVGQSIKDERMKTDLITNVSHDIKTPLTSIINYVDLLKRENFSDPKIVGYINILEQKSQRLKTLTEDVVEASKVSSGNITLEMMNINLVEMLNQIEGEFIEKFESRNLTVVMNKPEAPVIIYADGRRLSRILENIYGNAYKYAMEGTRIYADLRFTDGKAEFSLKNVSEQALNISADELTERFIRGDVSRTTEGSGLGLSIAKSLTELQGGTFELYLDGDLFKVTITFPVGK